MTRSPKRQGHPLSLRRHSMRICTEKEILFPFVTLVTNDLYDQFSNLNRPSIQKK